MIDDPVAFSGNAAAVVQAYQQALSGGGPLPAWNDAQFAEVRQQAKDHYKIKQDHRCCYCQHWLPVDHSLVWDAEHIVSKATHPRFLVEPLNLCVACKDCNGAKGDQEVLVNPAVVNYPTTGDRFKVVHPHFDNYEDHIRVLQDIVYIARSQKGKFTKKHCDLDRFTCNPIGWRKSILENVPLLKALDRLMSISRSDAAKAILHINVVEADGSTSKYRTELIDQALED